MTEKRYYKKDWEESYYVFDSNTISEDEFEERVECEGYDVFVDSLTGSEIIGLLNENEQLKQKNDNLVNMVARVQYRADSIKEENEQLKSELNMVHNNRLFSRRQLEKENDGLKQQIADLEEEIARQKYTKRMMRENIQDYEHAIKRLRKSFNDFDEMRLDRIRFLERRLKKHGLSIYVNDCGDVE